MSEGWISLHRELLDKPIWNSSTPEQKSVLIALLLMANHSMQEWEWKGEKFMCKEGQFVTSLDKIAKKAGKGISIQNVRTSLSRFEKYEFLTNESTMQNRLITICNWGKYQNTKSEINKDANNQLTNDQQSANKQLTTNNNDNKENNDNKDINIEFENFFDEYHRITKLSKSDKAAALKKWKTLTVSERKKALDKIQDYYNSLSDKKYCKKARTYLNDKNFNDEFSASLFPITTFVKQNPNELQ